MEVFEIVLWRNNDDHDDDDYDDDATDEDEDDDDSRRLVKYQGCSNNRCCVWFNQSTIV